jgi:hypothetical protein
MRAIDQARALAVIHERLAEAEAHAIVALRIERNAGISFMKSPEHQAAEFERRAALLDWIAACKSAGLDVFGDKPTRWSYWPSEPPTDDFSDCAHG